MEAKSKDDKSETDANESTRGEGVVEEPYVSPDVAAARNGEQVEMGKDLSQTNEEE
jgi:hypothetical protein